MLNGKIVFYEKDKKPVGTKKIIWTKIYEYGYKNALMTITFGNNRESTKIVYPSTESMARPVA